MKSIKSILALFVAVLLMSATTYAQRPTAPGADRANKMVEMMAEELGLSDAQIERITVIQNEFTEKMRAMRGNTNGDRTAMRDEMKKVAADRETAINNVLTEEQLTKWETMKAERGNRSGKRPDGKRPVMKDGEGKRPGMGERPKRPDTQRPVVKDGVKRPTNGGKRPTVDGSKRPRGERGMNRANKLQRELGLSETQAKELKKLTKAHQSKIKKLQANGKERKIKKTNKKYQKAVKKLLTPEQFEKFTAMKSERKVKKDILK